MSATSQQLREVEVGADSAHGCMDTIADDLERDLTESHRFSSLAKESDDERGVVPPTVPASDNSVRLMLQERMSSVATWHPEFTSQA